MIRVELTECELYEIYDDFLNNTNNLVTICGYEYEPAPALKLVDKVAYQEGFNEWLNVLIENGEITYTDDKHYEDF